MVATGHVCLSNTDSVGSVAEEWNFRLCLILINLNLDTYMCLVATTLDSTAPETFVKLGKSR